MRRWVASALMMLAVCGVARAAEKIFDPSRNPTKDLQAAINQTETEHKNILMDVGGNWCPWCMLLDRTLHEDQQLRGLLRRPML